MTHYDYDEAAGRWTPRGGTVNLSATINGVEYIRRGYHDMVVTAAYRTACERDERIRALEARIAELEQREAVNATV